MGVFDSWKVTGFDIYLSSTDLLPGRMLSGNVVFTVTSEMSFRSVAFKIIGREHTHVEITSTDADGNSSTNYYNEFRNFFKVHITALGMPKKSGEKWKGTLSPGTYNFPFAVRVPIDALPTMKNGGPCDFASVQYYVKAKIDIPFGFTDSKKVVPFTVLTALPVVQSLTASRYSPPHGIAKRVCCCCCSMGHTSVAVTTESNIIVFGMGSDLKGQITVNNAASKQPTETIEVSLTWQTRFTAAGYSRVAKQVISKLSIFANMQPGQLDDKTFSFQLVLPKSSTPHNSQIPFPSNFKGALMTNTYMVTFVSDGDLLGQVEMLAASSLDESNLAMPVQVDTMTSRTVQKGAYPMFLYVPPPGGVPQLPPQLHSVGPFPTKSTPNIPYGENLL